MTSNEVLLTSEVTGQLWNVCIWDFDTGNVRMTFKGGTTAPHGLAVLGQQYVISASSVKPVLSIWALQKNDQMQSKFVCPGVVTALTVTDDDCYCLAAISEKIYIWQTCTGNLLKVLSRHYQTVTCLRCSDDVIVSGGDDNMVIVWSLSRILADQSNISEQVSPDYVWSNHSLPITDVHIGIGGNLSRVISSSLDQTCRMYDVNSGEMLCTFLFDVGIHSVTMDAGELRLFAGSSSGVIYAVNLFETPVQRERHISTEGDKSLFYEGHTKPVTCLCVNMDGCQLISGSHDHSVKIWDIYSCQCLRTLEHKGILTNAVVIPMPPGILNPEQRTTLPIQVFQRHIHSEDGSREMLLNTYISNSEKVNKEHLKSDFVLKNLKDQSTLQVSPDIPTEELCKMQETISQLKRANSELYQFAMTEVLHGTKE